MEDISKLKAKELFALVVGEREAHETTAEYIDKINKKVMLNLGVKFVEYHREIWKLMAKLAPKPIWDLACAHITGYEKYWVKALKILVVENAPESYEGTNT